MAKVVAVGYIGKSPVYNMEVAETHDFVTADGVVLHNCYDECKYMLMEFKMAAYQPLRQPGVYKPGNFNPLADRRPAAGGKYVPRG